MAIQLNRGPSFGGSLGAALGGGLTETLKGLAQGRSKQASLQNLLQSGVSPEDAQLIGQFEPAEQVKLLSQLWQRPGAMQGQGPMQMMGEDHPEAQAGMQQQWPRSSFYQPTREELRKQEETGLKRRSVELKEADVLSKNPFVKEIRTASTAADKILPLIDQAKKVIGSVQATGPLAGNIPAFSSEAQMLDSILNQILLNKSALESAGGGRATKFFLQLQQMAKPSRAMNKKALLSRLADIENEASDVLKIQSIQDQVLEANRGTVPKNLEGQVRNVKRIVDRFPPASGFTEGAEAEEAGYRFKNINGQWVFQGR